MLSNKMKSLQKPESADIWKKEFITYRRLWLDFYLNKYSSEINGSVLDLGGKQTNKRGFFQPSENQRKIWWYINIDWETKPNIIGDVTSTPIRSDYFEFVLCNEVLEHLQEPKLCVSEIYRILKNGGIALISIPFLFPVHADPYDYQRYTEDGLRHLFSGFSTIEIFPMGGYWGTIGMLLELGLPGIKAPWPIRSIIFRLATLIGRIMCAYDIKSLQRQPLSMHKFTTGYFLKVTK
jgi:SAM-dependent methyltransferase